MEFEEFLDRFYSKLPEKAQEPVRIFVDGSIAMAPYLGKYYSQYQYRKLDRAFKSMSPRFEIIASKVESSEETEQLKEEVFPLIVSKMLNEPEEEKIKIMIYGFEYLIDKKINEIDKIYYYYDVLENLRLSDIIYLTKKFKPELPKKELSKYTKLNPKLRSELQSRSESEKAETKERNLEMNAMRKYVVNKLEGLGLIIKKDDADDYILSPFGERFIRFLSSFEEIVN